MQLRVSLYEYKHWILNYHELPRITQMHLKANRNQWEVPHDTQIPTLHPAIPNDWTRKAKSMIEV